MFKSKYIKSLTAGLVLATGLFMSADTSSAAKNFTDLNSSPSHAKSVTFLNYLDVFDYKTGNKLNGEQGVTRAEVAKVLHTLYEDAIAPVRKYSNNFKDVNSKTTYADSIAWAYESAILDGDANGNFNPNKVLTRAQMAKILVNAFPLESKGAYKFNDVSPNHWAYEYITILGANRISVGSNGNFMPDNEVTLNQLSTFICRILMDVMSTYGPQFGYTLTEEEKNFFYGDKFIDNTPQPEVAVGDPAQLEAQVVELVNVERAKAGLAPLTVNPTLAKAARDKSQDMIDNNYISHDSPTYGSPFEMMTSYGVSYRTAGENIAGGYPTAEAVVNGWMNSPGHRENILNPAFTEIGVGYVAKGHYWTQMFIGH